MSKNQDNKDIVKNLEEALNQKKFKLKPIIKTDKTVQKDLRKKKLSQALRANLLRRKND